MAIKAHCEANNVTEIRRKAQGKTPSKYRQNDIKKTAKIAPSSCCMFSPYPMKYELKPHLRIQAQCKVLRRSFGANFPSCCALLGPSPTISRQESKSCRTEDRVSGSSPQPSTFQEKIIHTFRQCINELDLISDHLNFKILLLGMMQRD